MARAKGTSERFASNGPRAAVAKAGRAMTVDQCSTDLSDQRHMEYECAAERRLLTAVIRQAVHDYTGRHGSIGITHGDYETARAFLFGPGPAFMFTLKSPPGPGLTIYCDVLGVDPEHILLKIRTGKYKRRPGSKGIEV